MKTQLLSAASRTLLDQVRSTGLAEELLLEVELRVAKRRKRRRAVKRAVVAVVAVLAFGCWLVPFITDTDAVTTAAAVRRTVTLADGSSADLNAQTAIRTDFRYGRRIVRLDRGEAFFSVAKDPAHPFWVKTPAGTIRVTGTMFNVRLVDERHAEITLLEGSVLAEEPTQAPVALTPGQQVVLDGAPPNIRLLSVADLENLTAWRQGNLVLDGLTIGEAAARFAAYHGVQIEVDSQVAGLRPGGTCGLNDLAQFLEALKATRRVNVLSNGAGTYRIVVR
jgi:transmembrane sensor